MPPAALAGVEQRGCRERLAQSVVRLCRVSGEQLWRPAWSRAHHGQLGGDHGTGLELLLARGICV